MSPNLFFTSDLHFDHANVIKHCNRPFSSVEEMNAGLIDNYNSVVGPNDTTYILGDISFSKTFEEVEAHFDQLNGTKIIVFGNHDWRFKKDYPKVAQSCWDYFELRTSSDLFVMSHFPFLSWNKSHRGSYNLHGHCHGNIDDQNVALKESGLKRLDVGVDSNDYRPISLEEIKVKCKLEV